MRKWIVKIHFENGKKKIAKRNVVSTAWNEKSEYNTECIEQIRFEWFLKNVHISENERLFQLYVSFAANIFNLTQLEIKKFRFEIENHMRSISIKKEKLEAK